MTTPKLNRLFTHYFLRYVEPDTEGETPVDPPDPMDDPTDDPMEVTYTFTERVVDSTPGDTRAITISPTMVLTSSWRQAMPRI